MPPQPPLQPRHRPGTGLAIGFQQLHAGGPQPDQGKFRGGEEGQQEQQCRWCQKTHRDRMGIARIELA